MRARVRVAFAVASLHAGSAVRAASRLRPPARRRSAARRSAPIAAHRVARGRLRIEDELDVDGRVPEFARHIGDTARKLALHPVELEAVGRGDAQGARIGVEVDQGQRFDPRDVLLRRKFSLQQCGTVLPEIVHRVQSLWVAPRPAAALAANWQQGPARTSKHAPEAYAARVCGRTAGRSSGRILGIKARF